MNATVEVWLAAPTVRPEDVAGWLTELSPVERERWRSLRRWPDRCRYLVGHRLVRRCLAAATGLDPGEVELDVMCRVCRGAHGRPTVVGTGGSPHRVSISHAGDVVAVAHEPGAPPEVSVGVDVELVSATTWDGFDETALTAAERTAVRRSGRAEDRATLWTRKEAVLKALGVGLAAPLADVELGDTLGTTHGRVVVAGRGTPGGTVDWAGASAPPPGYALTVARTAPATASAQPVRITADLRDGSALLR